MIYIFVYAISIIILTIPIFIIYQLLSEFIEEKESEESMKGWFNNGDL